MWRVVSSMSRESAHPTRRCNSRSPMALGMMKHVPTCSSMWTSGDRFAKLWDATLLKNFETFQNRTLRPVWLEKSCSVELERSQSRTQYRSSCRWAHDVQEFRSHLVLVLRARRCVDVGTMQKGSTADQDVVSGRWRRFGHGRRVSIWVSWSSGTSRLEPLEESSHVHWHEGVGEAWSFKWNCDAWNSSVRCQACAYELHDKVALNL